MKEDIYNYLDKFEEQTKKRFWELYKVIYESTSRNIDEKLWATCELLKTIFEESFEYR